MATLATPGVYVNFVPPSAQPIAGVGTSTAGFVGIGSRPEVRDKGPILVTSWAQFRRTFGDPDAAAGTPEALAPADRVLAHAVYGFFNNGGTRCYVSAVADATKVKAGLDG